MCGRFAFSGTIGAVKKDIDIKVVTCEVEPSFNIAPTHEILTLINHNGLRLGTLKWGLVPSWAKDTSMGSKMINARVETISEKPSFKDAFIKRRCLILASGFYEWKQEKNGKQPYFIRIKDEEIIGFAGIYEIWKSKYSRYSSCTIITTDACEDLAGIHSRMPMVLKREFTEKWLDNEIKDPEKIKEILINGCYENFEYHKVSKEMNHVSKNDSSCIAAF